MYFPPYGDTIGSIVVKHINGQLVDVVNGQIYPACVNFHEGKVIRIERKVAAPLQYILPGLIDSHIHIESSLLTPYRFAEQAVVHGTTAVVGDPSLVASAAGLDGIRFLQTDARASPLRFYYGAPSCLPSSTGFDWKAVRQLLSEKEFVVLSEVTDVAKVLNDDPEVVSKLEVAEQFGKPIDGRAPGLTGYNLDRYIMAGVTSDDECSSVHEAEDKRRRGMTIMVKEGTGSSNLVELAAFAKTNPYLLATGHLGPGDLLQGHMDLLLRKEVAAGVEPMQAVRAATLWPAERYGLAGGSLYIGGAADLIVVNDLKEFKVLETWIGGELVAKDGAPLFLGNPSTMGTPYTRAAVSSADLESRGRGPVARKRLLEVTSRDFGAGRGQADLAVQNGTVMAVPSQDIALLALVDPWSADRPRTAFVKGLGLRTGAMATSQVIGDRGILAAGADPNSLADAVNAVLRTGGGMAAVRGSERAVLGLPVVSLMSAQPAAEVAKGEEAVRAMVRAMGSELPAPLLSLAHLGREAAWVFEEDRAFDAVHSA